MVVMMGMIRRGCGTICLVSTQIVSLHLDMNVAIRWKRVVSLDLIKPAFTVGFLLSLATALGSLYIPLEYPVHSFLHESPCMCKLQLT